MIANDYIKQKFQTFGIQLSDADLLEISLLANIKGEGEVSENDLLRINYGISKFIPSLLLRAKSISESGFSMSWDLQAIKDYYAYLCKQLGLKDELNLDKPKVTFL